MPNGALDVLVIGAGQAGLATGYHLKRRSLDFYIVEQSERIGDGWRKRYDSLTLFTPRAFSALPEMPLTGDPDGYPSRDEFADYLESYAARWQLPVGTGVRVVELARDGGDFLAMLSDGSMARSRSVVIATGGFQNPARPAIATKFNATVSQFDPESYRNPQSLSPGRVLVVSDGASGRDIAMELAATHDTVLAVGGPRRLFPERILGRSVWWWLKSLDLMRVRPDSLLGRSMRRADPFPDRDRSLSVLQAKGVRIVSRLIAAEGRLASFFDGAASRSTRSFGRSATTTILAGSASPVRRMPRGKVMHAEGVSPAPGLFFVGRPWQRNRASALVMGVGDDAEAIMRQIAPTRPA